MPTIKIHNIETGEVIDREMTADELDQYEKDQEYFATEKTAKIATEAEKQALLEKLGITEEEAKLLLS